MTLKLSYLLKWLAVFGTFTVLLASVGRVYAVDPLVEACKVPDSVLCRESNKPQEPGNNSIYGPNGIITKALNLLSYAIGIAAVVAIIVGGIKYVLSSGDSNNINSAKNTILYAAIGLAISISAQGIILFVLNRLP